MLSLYLQHRASFGWQVFINTSNLHKVELQQRQCKSKNSVPQSHMTVSMIIQCPDDTDFDLQVESRVKLYDR